MPIKIRNFCLGMSFLILLATSCSQDESDSSARSNSDGFVSNPRMDEVEELSETVANRLIEFSYRLKERDLLGATEYLDNSFVGTHINGGTLTASKKLPLGATEGVFEFGPNPTLLDRDAFLKTLDKTLATFSTIDRVFFKTRGAEFNVQGDRARLKMTASFIGTTPQGGRHSIYSWANAAAKKSPQGWVLTKFVVELTRQKHTNAVLFSDVADAAGVAVDGPRVGTGGNDKFYWRGASVADFDGDGRPDIFSSGFKRNFLYRNRGDGTFEEVAEEFKLAQPAGPTSVLFFDYDRDGDKDLFMAFVGWEDDGVPLGGNLRLFRNDGDKFSDVSVEVGMDAFRGPAFSSIAGDFDGDGWLDLYVCNYERLDAAYPNSWFAATNGAQNFLLMNKGGKSFEDEASARGIKGKFWTFAAAAADFDRDGDLDIYSVNDYGENDLFVNDGQGNFSNRAREEGVLDCGNGMGAAWGDFNADGQLDLYVSNMSSSAGKRILSRLAEQSKAKGVQKTLYKLAAGNSLFVRGTDTFVENPPENGARGASWAWSPVIFDANLDGHDDIYVANGFISGDSLKDT